MSRAPIRIILWFDTEDYLLPADDDATLRLAAFLTRQGIRAVFKLVGEKARVLVRRGRRDVIAALKRHEIGYHTDFHSVHPTVAEHLSPLGWDEGVAEFLRREGPGYEDVRRIFGVRPACYGQPGSSWGPQVFGAMRKWGMPVYMDSGRHVGLDGEPHFYGGALTFFRLRHETRVELKDPGDLEAAKRAFLAIRRDLGRRARVFRRMAKLRGSVSGPGGLVSIVYHPCEFVHRAFWDSVNFARGANPPRERWRLPPAKNPAGVAAAFANFEGYIRFLRSFPEVEFITPGAAARLYRDRAVGRRFGRRELAAIAGAVTPRVTFQRRDGYALAAADVFFLLNEAAAGGGLGAVRLEETPFGPADPVPVLARPVRAEWSQVKRTAADVSGFMRLHGRLPAAVWVGSVAVPPESWLVAVAAAVRPLLSGRRRPAFVTIPAARLAAAKYVADDDPGLWGWTVFPRGFRAPAMMALARRQAWTLKPAIGSRPARVRPEAIEVMRGD